MVKTETQEFKLNKHTFDLQVSPEYLFMPNAVTRIFAKCVQINDGDVVFDIGSGTGPLAVWAGLEPSAKVHAVEIVKAQYEILIQNLRINKVDDHVYPYYGSFFEPIPLGIKADVIIADVSGIANGPARALGWYPKEIPTGGEDGTEVIVPLLEQAGQYMKPEGRLYFPVGIGLSNSERTMDTANKHFENLERLVESNFTLEPEQVEAMTPFLDLPYINLQSKGTRTIWKGEFWKATKPR